LIVGLECGGALNPWWGEAPARIVGPPLFNALALAFVPPAMLALAAAGRWRERLPRFAKLCLGAAIALIGAWAILEARHAFHGATMAVAPVGWLEAIAYALIGAAAILALRTRADRERFAQLVHGGYERLAGGPR
jgi:hypothetical protein